MAQLQKSLWIGAVLGLIFTAASAQILWSPRGVPARRDYTLNWSGSAVKNGAGDTYVAWEGSPGEVPGVYCQKYNSSGQVLWAQVVEAGNGSIVQMATCVTSDNGLVVAWGTQSSGSPSLIHAQKLDANGNLLWPAGGVIVGRYLYAPGNDGSYSDFSLVADTSGGIFVLWNNEQGSNQTLLLAKHLLADGSLAPGWNPSGTVIMTNIMDFRQDYACADGLGGFVVAWQQYYMPRHHSIHAQHMNGSAHRLWGNHGVQLCNSANNSMAMTTDGAGGAFFAWSDQRSNDGDIYMQRVDHNGNILWQAGGLPLIQYPQLQTGVQLVPDGSGGFLAVWEDDRFEANYEYALYYQHVNGSGTLLWTPSGYQLVLAEGYVVGCQIAPDGVGGFFASWSQSTYYAPDWWQDSYVQHVMSSGLLAWQSPGGLLLRGGSYKYVDQTIPVSAGSTDALFYWYEARDDHAGVYLQKINASGQMQFPSTGWPVVEILAGGSHNSQLTALTNDRFLSVWGDQRYSQQCGLIYYQIHDAQGNALLQPDGVPINFQTQYSQDYPKVTATSDGGAVISWMVAEGIAVKTQKINAQGALLWYPSGVPVTASPQGFQSDQFVCADAIGGAYVSFYSSGGMRLQHLDANGNRLFGSLGLQITQSGEDAMIFNLLPDSEGGTIVVMSSSNIAPICAKRILPSGAISWTATIYNMPVAPWSLQPVAIAAHEGGAIVAWQDLLGVITTVIYAQKFNNAGEMLWAENGVAVDSLPADDNQPALIEDLNGYVYVAWEKGYIRRDIYAQRLTPQGARMFGPGGIAVSNAPLQQSSPRIVADGHGGAIFTWNNSMNFSTAVYATHLNAEGQIADPFWQPNGNPIAASPGFQSVQNTVPDGSGGAVIGFDHYDRGLYLQRVNDNEAVGTLPQATTPARQNLINCAPNPFNPSTTISYQLQAPSYVSLKVYDTAGRLVATVVDGWRDAGTNEAIFDGSKLASGIYLASLEAGEFSVVQKVVLMK